MPKRKTPVNMACPTCRAGQWCSAHSPKHKSKPRKVDRAATAAVAELERTKPYPKHDCDRCGIIADQCSCEDGPHFDVQTESGYDKSAKVYRGDNINPGRQEPQPQVVKPTTFVLTHEDGRRYLFDVQGLDVAVQRVQDRQVHRYLMPLEEGRYMYGRLRKQGFQAF